MGEYEAEEHGPDTAMPRQQARCTGGEGRRHEQGGGETARKVDAIATKGTRACDSQTPFVITRFESGPSTHPFCGTHGERSRHHCGRRWRPQQKKARFDAPRTRSSLPAPHALSRFSRFHPLTDQTKTGVGWLSSPSLPPSSPSARCALRRGATSPRRTTRRSSKTRKQAKAICDGRDKSPGEGR